MFWCALQVVCCEYWLVSIFSLEGLIVNYLPVANAIVFVMVACKQAYLVCYSSKYLGGGSREPARRMGRGKVSLHESHWILNSPCSSMSAAFWLVWSDTRWQTSLFWQITSKVVLLFVTFLGFLDCKQSLSSPIFSKKENRMTARSLSVFQSIQFLNVTQLVASG